MAAVLPPAPLTFEDLLINVLLRFSQDQADTLIAEGYDTPNELRFWELDEIQQWCSNKTKLPATRGGCAYGNPRKVSYLQAYAFWCTDMH